MDRHLVITIAREFASGGRELGRRLADEMGIAYYDQEILYGIEKKTDYALSYIQSISEEHRIVLPSIHYGNSIPLYHDAYLDQEREVYKAQAEIIRECAKKSDCVIIGRGADVLLRDIRPFRIYVYADMDSRVARSKKRAKGEEVSYSEKKWIRTIRSVDRKRRSFYSFYTGMTWGKKENYDLLINTTGKDLKKLAHYLSLFLQEERKNSPMKA